MSDRYLLICHGQHYKSVSLDEARRILIDVAGYSDAYASELLDKVGHDALCVRAGQLCERIEDLTADIRKVCRNIDEEIRQCLGLRKSGSAQKEAMLVESPRQFSERTNTEADRQPNGQP